jgi:hypothetical protein
MTGSWSVDKEHGAFALSTYFNIKMPKSSYQHCYQHRQAGCPHRLWIDLWIVNRGLLWSLLLDLFGQRLNNSSEGGIFIAFLIDCLHRVDYGAMISISKVESNHL